MTTRQPPSARRPRTARRAGRLALAGSLLAGSLLVAGCSAPAEPATSEPAPADPHGATGPAASPSGSPGTGSAAPDGSSAATAEARADRRAVSAAAERAASFGFTDQVPASDEGIERTRQESRLRQANTSGTTVDPQECKAPLTAVDWSPILLTGADASRVDFGSGSFAGTGTVEVASVTDPEVVREHLANVERLVADCPELRMTVTDGDLQEATFDFTARASQAVADSGLVWTRTPAGGGDETTAQVLISRAGDHVVMVSFIGQPEVAGKEFTTMAQQVLDAATGAL